MGRGPRPAKGRTKPAVARTSPNNDGARVRDLEKRLAEAEQREAEALKREAATSEILRVISSLPTNLQPVLDAIAERAARLCSAADVKIHLVAGDRLRLAAQRGPIPSVETRPIIPTRHIGRAVLERRTIHVHDMRIALDEFPDAANDVRNFAVRTALATPLLREGTAIGVIHIRRLEVEPFSAKQIALLETFADQAVIAIENVRLFKELEARNGALTESLEQQTATSEILQVISRSPTDDQPVFEAIVENARRLCEATYSVVFLVEDGRLALVAVRGVDETGIAALQQEYPMAINRSSTSGRAILDRDIIHVADSWIDPEYTHPLRDIIGLRSILTVPIFREGQPIGAISVWRGEPRPFSDKQIALLQTFTDQAVIAIENVRLFTELQEKNQALTEAHRQVTDALDQQTATAEILRVIASSPTNVQPVFETIVQSAQRLLAGHSAAVMLRIGDEVHLGAYTSTGETDDAEVRSFWPLSIRTPAVARVFIDRETEQISDVESDPRLLEVTRTFARHRGWRSRIVVPMHRAGAVCGAIAVTRRDPGPFSEEEIAVLKTFADQAVIAIENARLFKELEARNSQLTEALEQQTATSEILRVISSSPTDVQPVFQSIAESAVRLSGGLFGSVYRFDGELIHMVAHYNYPPAALEFSERIFPMRPSRQVFTGRAILERAVVNVGDVSQDPELTLVLDIAGRVGFQSVLSVPLMRDGSPVGAITVWRSTVGLFSNEHIALLQTFADQAVIAIENVRLFKELQASNQELREALDTQTATSEILRVISQSQTDVQPVFDAIVRSAVRLCGGLHGVVDRFDGELIHFVAQYNYTPEALQMTQRMYPRRPDRKQAAGRAILTGDVVNIADVQADPEYATDLAVAGGWRSVLNVPMLREGKPIGTIGVIRGQAGLFSDAQVELLRTFADQAVIAIENVRLFTELQVRTEELIQSVEQLKALGDVARAVSSTLDLDTVLNTIVSRAIELSGTDGGSVYEYDETAEEFSLRASRDLPEAYVERIRDARPRKGEGAVGRVAQTREPVQIADISDATAYESRVRNMLLQMGLRALLAVPLIAEDQLVGALIVMRKRTGLFAEEEIALLQTFATQSALAIQNARLFREIEEKSRQLEVASQHKSEFLANMSHELRTPLNAIIGFSEVLTDRMFGELNEKQEEYLKDIYASGTHLLSLINDILDLSKIEAGRMELELTEFDLPTALDNALMLVRERAQRRSLTLDKEVGAGVGQIRGDERKIRQVVLNLLSNAIKFTPEGGRIELAAITKDGCVEVSVSDTGVGIAPEDQEKVFEEFRQVGTSDKKAEGTGLGLTLCRKFIELHRGKIWVKSQLGVGSTFTFTIPVRGDDGPRSA